MGVALRAESSKRKRELSLSSSLTAEWPYWRSRSSWVGGEHDTVVVLDHEAGPGATIGTQKVWDKGGKCRSGTNSYATVRIESTVPDRLVLLAGLITVSAKRVRGHKGVYAARWVEQKANSANSPLRTVSG